MERDPGTRAADLRRRYLGSLTAILRRAYTEHLGQLTCTRRSPAFPGMRGTDLGVSFVQDGRRVFLFGDTLADEPALQDVDLAATAPLTFPADGTVPPLTWLGRLAPPGLPLARMGVPTDGVAVGDDTYVFFATGFDAGTETYATSALARTRGLDVGRLEVLHDVAADHFANVSVIVEGGEAFIFGTGAYRKSAIRLARVPVTRLGDRTAWQIEPRPVIDVGCAGELSARKHPTLPLYMIAFTSREPRGVALWLADHPGGPWRSSCLLYEPADGYERFLHAKESAVGHDDGLSDLRQEETWGGEYAPYFVPSWFSDAEGALGVVFTLSSWNPYQVHLVRAWLVQDGVTRASSRPSELRTVSFTLRGSRGAARLWHRGEIVRESRAPGMFRTRRVRWNVEAFRREDLEIEVDRVRATEPVWS